MESLLLVTGLVALILLGAPIALAMIILPVGYILATDAVPLLTVPHQMYEAIASPALLAVPFFMLTGELMNSSSVTERILELSRAMVGRVRGGLAQVNVVSSMFFAGMNGSAVADTATIGTVLIPAMKRAGYSAPFAAAITAATSTIGGIIPPSIAMIILASMANLSVGAMFAAGIVPGILIGLLFMVVTAWLAYRRNYERSEQPFSLRGLGIALWRAGAALLIPLALLVGLLGGIFSSVEAGAITALLALGVGAAVYRGMTLRDVLGALERTVRMSASVFIVIAASGPFSWLLTKVGAIETIESFLLSFAGSPMLFVLMLVLFILLVGTFLDLPANIIVFGPMLVSVAATAGFPPITTALVVVVGFLLGMVTPPVGACWFVANRIAECKLEHSAVELIPFMLVEVVVLFLMFAFPVLTLGIPQALGLL
ncbi:MAG: TRAP transporter large permease [Lautropia sp.]